MRNKNLLRLWAALFIICAFCGLVQSQAGSLEGFLTFLSVIFFIPPAVVLIRAKKKKLSEPRLLIRNLSGASLALTLVLLVLNFLSVLGSRTLGNILHYILTIVSTPMICSGHWILSIFLWACLFVGSIKE